LKSNFKKKPNDKSTKKESPNEKEKQTPDDDTFTDLWSFRSKKNQKL
jgi:hypothetical protein